MTEVKKRFSIRKKLLFIIGTLTVLSLLFLGFLATTLSGRAVTEKVEGHLIDKAIDTAEVIEGRITSFWQFMEGIAKAPVLSLKDVSMQEKLLYLKNEVAFNDHIERLNLCDLNGVRYMVNGETMFSGDRDYYLASVNGKNFVSEPSKTRVDGSFVINFTVPVYDNERNIIYVLLATVDAAWLSKQIEDIRVGKSGRCYILGTTGVDIADEEFDAVLEQSNVVEEAKTDSSLKSLAAFEYRVVNSEKSEVGFYTYEGVKTIASFATIPSTNWKVVVFAPVNEFMGTVQRLGRSMWLIGLIILFSTFVIVWFIAGKMVEPVKNVASALKNISQGEGDLTVRLPLIGNDEVTEVSEYFNLTIEKIGKAIKTVGENSSTMEGIGEELSSNMTETASAINQINANIESVKEQSLTQAASVTETAGTMEEIIRTIEQLNSSIEHQSSSVVQSSASVEEMVANIASISQTLEKTDGIIKNLSGATSEGKLTLQASNITTQKIAEESGSLIEASNVIQNIAEQTNLLAMNAAIEAAHAGESGKGFAVVADEIRKLAEESSVQGKTITDTLKNLSDEITGLAKASRTVEEKFNVIFTLAENVRNMSAELTQAMHEQSNGSKEVLAAIKDISRITSEVKNGSEEMLVGGKSVADEMQKLDRLTIEIKDSMNEMSAGVVQINNAVQEVNNLAQQNKESIRNLAGEVRKFKV